ncbi:hypothetical protein K439DRAFT_1663636, partial [Ramaria rubella]
EPTRCRITTLICCCTPTVGRDQGNKTVGEGAGRWVVLDTGTYTVRIQNTKHYRQNAREPACHCLAERILTT